MRNYLESRQVKGKKKEEQDDMKTEKERKTSNYESRKKESLSLCSLMTRSLSKDIGAIYLESIWLSG